jgi:hypothetical protein
MKNFFTVFFVIALFQSVSIAATREGPYGMFSRSCSAEFNRTYSSNVAVPASAFCHCYGRGYVKEAKSDVRNMHFNAEKEAGRPLRFKQDLINMGLGDLQSKIEFNCKKNTNFYE